MKDSATKQYLDLYGECREMICNHSCEVMNALRDDAYDVLCQKGLPNRKVEEYKYTSMQDVFAPNYGLNINRLAIPVNPYDAFKCDVPNLSTQLYFVVNDMLYRSQQANVSSMTNAEGGFVVTSLCEAAGTHAEILNRYYGKIADNSDPVTALNNMLAQDGLFIYIPRNVKVERAIQVVNILRSDVDMMINRRVLVVAEQGASARLLFCDHAADDHAFLATQVVEVYVGDDADIEIYGLEETHIKSTLVSNTYITQQRDSRLHHSLITLHNGQTRQQTCLTFNGEGAECWLNGGVIADKQQRVDNNTLIDHAVPHCQSHELYKYVLDDEAVGAFAGKVLVRKDAQKTVSEERNQNLCATKKARMYTQPMLEIYADDVKCSHGSTVGQLNDKALFYMQQRGIPLKEARTLLQTAFIYEVIDEIQLEPLRDRLHYLVEKRFRGELSKCEGCKLCR